MNVVLPNDGAETKEEMPSSRLGTELLRRAMSCDRMTTNWGGPTVTVALTVVHVTTVALGVASCS